MSATATMTDAPVLQLSVPDLAERLPMRCDLLRKLVRTRPELAAMFTKVGPTRMLPETKIEEFRTALASH